MQAIAQIDPLQIIIDNLRAMLPEMSCMADSLEHYDNIGYFRVCQPNERVADLLAEAKEHCSVLAFKGDATVIMPTLAEGWSLNPISRGEDELEWLRRLV
jgi:hypothetical protein